MSASSPAHLGGAIRALRTARQLTIEALAGAADIHTTYLSGIERGQRNPSWRIVGSLATALGVEISELAREAEHLARTERERQD
ncbi:MAG TPA: helix-turn-helix transcriptional regulator [Solirubrobacterales bacterium]|nr:helix-turn-helix transcriptional regulator [Solirubrobacterales bacterium]